LSWVALQDGTAGAEGLRRHAAHPELDPLGLDPQEDGILVVLALGEVEVPDLLPAGADDRAIRDHRRAADQRHISIVGIVLEDDGEAAGPRDLLRLAGAPRRVRNQIVRASSPGRPATRPMGRALT